MGRRGGPTIVFTLLLSFFSGSLRSPVLYKHFPRHIYDIKTTMSSVCSCTEAFNCTKKNSLPKINLDVDLNHTSAEGKGGKNKLNPLFSLSLSLFFFFFACQKYSDSWTPPPRRKFLDPCLRLHRCSARQLVSDGIFRFP